LKRTLELANRATKPGKKILSAGDLFEIRDCGVHQEFRRHQLTGRVKVDRAVNDARRVVGHRQPRRCGSLDATEAECVPSAVAVPEPGTAMRLKAIP